MSVPTDPPDSTPPPDPPNRLGIPLTDGDESGRPVNNSTGLCLSGGGYRAMLFHVGVLWRMRELAWLPRLDRVSSVSGGSITAGVLAMNWDRLAASGFAADTFLDNVVTPLRRLAHKSVAVPSVVRGFFPGRSVGLEVENRLRRQLFNDATLSRLPTRPDFTFQATNVATGKAVRFDRMRVSDYTVGSVSSAAVPLAAAVTASASFPPFLSPYRLPAGHLKWRKSSKPVSDVLEYQRTLVLTDGGVYDNLGIESVWQNCGRILVSDGGGRLKTTPRPASDWPRHFVRVSFVLDHQVRSLRTRQIQAAYSTGEREGTYIGIRTEPEELAGEVDGGLPVDDSAAASVAAVGTGLSPLSNQIQESLINWGYAIADLKLRKWVDTTAAPPTRFPYDGGVR